MKSFISRFRTLARKPAQKAFAATAAVAALAGCALPQPALPDRQTFYGGPHPTRDFADIDYANWSDQEPAYRLYPGDVLDVAFPTAPELARSVTVQPDGRITLPYVPPMMAADRSVQELDAELGQAYAGQLLRPEVEVTVKQAAPIQVFVGGQVKTPGVYAMAGDVNALQAVIMAGDFLVGARRQEVVIIRRGAGGRPMMRTVDLRRAIYGAGRADAVPLRRFDIIYVPKTSLQELGDFVTQIRNALPVQFSYVIGGQYVTN
jgi:polysaccharide export outer membrane protein